MGTILEQFRVSDFLEWHKQKRLILSPDFQRGNVWKPAARSYLIDTILRELPMPKVYLRTRIDVTTKQLIREVVDGQQRLRTIIDFANDKLTLSSRAGEFEGMKYSTIGPELQERFLSYPIAVGQLLNANDDEVLEIFARLNSYSVKLNAAETRHAMYQGEFKWAVRNASRRWIILWDDYKVITVRERVRMADDSLMAEMFGLLLEGVRDGGEAKINSIYKRYDETFDSNGETPKLLDHVLEFFVANMADDLIDTQLLKGPHFLMLFAAIAHALHGLPQGDMGKLMPERNPTALSNIAIAKDNLLELASILEEEKPSEKFVDFWLASKSTTHRISSRRRRFPIYYQALLPKRL